jgi:hypothetical protein
MLVQPSSAWVGSSFRHRGRSHDAGIMLLAMQSWAASSMSAILHADLGMRELGCTQLEGRQQQPSQTWLAALLAALKLYCPRWCVLCVLHATWGCTCVLTALPRGTACVSHTHSPRCQWRVTQPCCSHALPPSTHTHNLSTEPGPCLCPDNPHLRTHTPRTSTPWHTTHRLGV